LSLKVPNAGEMAHLSRPYQIALGGLVVLALAWFVVLHRPGSSPSEPVPAPVPASAPTSAAKAPAPGASTPVYHGAVPGLTGLTRDIARAHGAVATSEQNAKQLQEKSARASNEATPSASTGTGPSASANTGASASAGATATRSASPSSSTTVTVHKLVTHKPAATAANATATALARQLVEQAVLKTQLQQGKVVLLLFWNPKATDDKAVRREVQAVSAHRKGGVAVHVALPSQVSLYGSVTRNVGVFQTPSLLVIGKRGLAVTLTGLVDQYTIEQAILEAKLDSAHGA
jgi:hypothetical protein